MRTLKLTLAYDGTNYAGWQVQLQAPSIQKVLEDAIERVTQVRDRVVASGRTDAGVHAAGQVVSWSTESLLPAKTLKRALNASLPQDVAVLEVAEAAAGFHAIRDCLSKRYRYVIHDGPIRDVFQLRYSWHYRQRLDDEAMRMAAEALRGRHDFASFQTGGAARESTVRTILDTSVQRSPIDEDCLEVEFEADGFLYNMVRAMVGTLVDVGRGAFATDHLARVMAAGERSAAGITAPPQGLILLRVHYDD